MNNSKLTEQFIRKTATKHTSLATMCFAPEKPNKNAKDTKYSAKSSLMFTWKGRNNNML